MNNRTHRKRWNKKRRKYGEQTGACCYCDGEMLLADVEAGPSPLTLATFEHLLQRVDGGTLSDENTKLACLACNRARPVRMAPPLYRRVRQGLLHIWPVCTTPSRPVRCALSHFNIGRHAPERMAA